MNVKIVGVIVADATETTVIIAKSVVLIIKSIKVIIKMINGKWIAINIRYKSLIIKLKFKGEKICHM